MTTVKLAPGLYLVATPIGAARDITLRALDILGSADIIAAEDTRNARKLMDIHGIKRNDRPIIPYHDHNGAQMRPRILRDIAEGKSVAFVSDAGTPLVADPGFTLAREVIRSELDVVAAPGPSAVITALMIAGLPSDKFMFAGFPPTKAGQRAQMFQDLAQIPATLIFYESPKRLEKSVAAMEEAFGPDRQAAISRELTKKFEQTIRGNLGDMPDRLGGEMLLKGEFVVAIGPPVKQEVSSGMIDAAILEAIKELSVKDAASQVAKDLNLPKKTIYNRAIELKG